MENTLRFPRQWSQLAVSDFLGQSFDWLVAALVFITIFLPSGSIYGLNLKWPVYLLVLPLAVYTFFEREHATPEKLAFSLAVPALLLVWVVIGVLHGFTVSAALRQYTDICLTLLLCWLVCIFRGHDMDRSVSFLRLVVLSEVATSVFKLAIVGYGIWKGIPTVELVAMLSKVFGVELMTMSLGPLFARVQFVSDAMIPVCVFIILRHRDRMRLGNVRAAFFVLILIASVAYSFSRYFWASTALALVLGFISATHNRFRLIVCIMLAVVSIAMLPALIPLYQLRFSHAVAGTSDRIRVEETHALEEFYRESPLLGNGLGSYTNQVVRVTDSEDGRYSYETQLLALTSQMGLVGAALLVLLAAYYYSDLWWTPTMPLKDRWVITAMIVAWFSAGLYNPLLFHPVAGVNYAAFATLASLASVHPQGKDPSGTPVVE
jgi:hypothetical protein